jgi:hypothetical protein
MGQLVMLDPARLNAREEHGGSRKNALAIPLDEVRGRGPDREVYLHKERGDNPRMGRLICRRSSGRSEARVIVKIYWRSRCAGYVPTNELRVIDPRFETKAERVQHQDFLGSTSARLLADVVRAVAIASGTMRRNAEKCRNIERVRQERIAHHRHHPPRTSF